MWRCRLIPVIADSYVEREFGTGALKITPGHDPNDYEIGKRCDLELINIMGDDGSMNANAGQYEGLDRFEARKKLWADMKVSQWPFMSSAPHLMSLAEASFFEPPLYSKRLSAAAIGSLRPMLMCNSILKHSMLTFLSADFADSSRRWCTLLTVFII